MTPEPSPTSAQEQRTFDDAVFAKLYSLGGSEAADVVNSYTRAQIRYGEAIEEYGRQFWAAVERHLAESAANISPQVSTD